MTIPLSEFASEVLADGTHGCRPLVWHETESSAHRTAAYGSVGWSPVGWSWRGPLYVDSIDLDVEWLNQI